MEWRTDHEAAAVTNRAYLASLRDRLTKLLEQGDAESIAKVSAAANVGEELEAALRAALNKKR